VIDYVEAHIGSKIRASDLAWRRSHSIAVCPISPTSLESSAGLWGSHPAFGDVRRPDGLRTDSIPSQNVGRLSTSRHG
jgi:hypothetical protein